MGEPIADPDKILDGECPFYKPDDGGLMCEECGKRFSDHLGGRQSIDSDEKGGDADE